MKLNISCTKSWFVLVKLGVLAIGIMGQYYSHVFVVCNRLENYLVVHSLVNLLFKLNSIAF